MNYGDTVIRQDQWSREPEHILVALPGNMINGCF